MLNKFLLASSLVKIPLVPQLRIIEQNTLHGESASRKSMWFSIVHEKKSSEIECKISIVVYTVVHTAIFEATKFRGILRVN